MNLLLGSGLRRASPLPALPRKAPLSLPLPQQPMQEQEVTGHWQGSRLAHAPVPDDLGHSPQSLGHFMGL